MTSSDDRMIPAPIHGWVVEIDLGLVDRRLYPVVGWVGLKPAWLFSSGRLQVSAVGPVRFVGAGRWQRVHDAALADQALTLDELLQPQTGSDGPPLGALQKRVLGWLRQHPATNQELVRALGNSSGAVSRATAALEKRGQVVRRNGRWALAE